MAPWTSNHAKLIQDCYPPKPEGLPTAVSNNLGKLTFYAIGRPKKLPKVSAALFERAQKDAKSSSGQKGRTGLAVTIDIYKGLATECRSELRVFGEHALRVVEMGLSRRDGSKRDHEMEARAASLFCAVATFTTGPFVGRNDAQGKQYLRCLSLFSSTAQLGQEDAISRSVALGALNGAAGSEGLYAQTASYDSQVEQIVPAILYNCTGVAPKDLRKLSTAPDDTAAAHNFGALDSRKSADVEAPGSPPSTSDLAAAAVKTLQRLSQLSHGAQLSSALSAAGTWLDAYKAGALWQDQAFVEWLGATVTSSSPVQYRAGAVGWWVEQVVEIDDVESTAKSETLLYTLATILCGPQRIVGLGIGSVLGQLTSLVIQRAPLGDEDPLVPHLLSTVSSLASAHVYYVDQVNDVVADLVESIRSVRDGTGAGARLMGRGEKKRATRRLVGALRQVLAEAEKGDGEVQVAVPMKNGDTSRSRRSSVKGDGQDTVRGNGLGHGESDNRDADRRDGAVDALGRPVMRVQSAGKRSRVAPDVMQQSLFLLTDPDPTTRRDYQRALIAYIEKEMEVSPVEEDGPVIDPTQQLESFFRDLHVAIYELATSSALAQPGPELDGGNDLSRNPSRLSRRKSVSSGRAVSNATANAYDYSSLAAIVRAVQLRKSPTAVKEGVPMLLALYDSAAKWETESAERAQACREVALQGLEAVGEAWNMHGVSDLAGGTLAKMSPSVLPALQSKHKTSTVPDFAANASQAAPSLPVSSVVDDVLSSRALQNAAGHGLSDALTAPWSAHREQKRTNRKSTLMSNGSRSVTNLTNSLRVTSSSTPERPSSIFAPSLAELQSSLGQPASSIRGDRTSATPSIASTSGTGATGNTQRRSLSKTRENVLSSLQVSQPPSRSSSISKVPYVA